MFDYKIGFWDFYNTWRANPRVKMWQNSSNWVILEFVEEGNIYHASFMMETKHFQVYLMRKWVWADGKGYGLEIQKRLGNGGIR